MTNPGDILGAAFRTFFPFGLIMVLAALALYRLYRLSKSRKELQALATARGWTYVDEDTLDIPRRFLDFAPFGKGHACKAIAVASGPIEGLQVAVFDYQYVTGSGRSRQTHECAVLAVALPISAPELAFSPEGVVSRLAEALGGNDIDFESDDFSRKFRVTCADRKFAYKVFTPDMMEFLLAHPTSLSWQWRGRWLVIHRTGAWKRAEAEQAIAVVTGFARRLPRLLFVEEQQWMPVPGRASPTVA